MQRALSSSLLAATGFGCSNLLIPSGSTSDGSTIIAYSADSGNLMGDIYNWPAADHDPKNDLREIYSWDFGTHLGAIPEIEHTYNVIGNTNEHQLTIGETTFGGLEQLNCEQGKGVCSSHGCIDYGQLIWVTLQRAKTAREAISTLDNLMQTYGYASSGESFSIADPNEVWLMEIIGKGKYAQGTVWVATRIPDGYVCAHANQARTRTFARDSPDSVMFATDVESFARSIGLYNGSSADFSFSDVYDPVTFSGARFCEARVFSFFDAVAAPEENIGQYLDYVQGYNLTNRMPLFIKTKTQLSVNDTMWHMRNHYEGTWLDPTKDVGAQAWDLPNRLGEGLEWTYGSSQYVNERPIGTQYAAWNFIGHQRPNELYSVLWFGPDDSTFSLHTPFYGPTDQVPPAWSGGNCTGRDACKAQAGLPGTMADFSFQSQHWVQNLIANYAYSRYDQLAPFVHGHLAEAEGNLFQQVAEMDAKLKQMPADQAAAEAAKFSYATAEQLHQSSVEFFGKLFSTFVDGYRAVPDPSNLMTGLQKVNPGFSDSWKKTIVQATGNHYKVPDTSLKVTAQAVGAIDKMTLRGVGGR